MAEIKEVKRVPESEDYKTKRWRKQARLQNVGIYARVSTNRKAQLHSMAAQVSELTRFVADRPDWLLTDIYLDFDSASGVKMRDEFERMISDAKRGKMDILITKSVQRFGRNTEENIEAMRTLVASGVVLYFQIEGISSDQPDSELQVTLYSALAQADNASRREDRMWGVTQKAQNGTSGMYTRACYGYTKNVDGVLSIDNSKAEVVKMIYRAYLNGASISGIKKMLEEKEIPSPSGGETWSARTIDMILSNEKYYGNIILSKTVMVGYPNSVRKDNSTGAYRERYCITNGVDSIIDEETFQKVQEEKKRRSNFEEGPDGKHRKKTKYSSKRE